MSKLTAIFCLQQLLVFERSILALITTVHNSIFKEI